MNRILIMLMVVTLLACAWLPLDSQSSADYELRIVLDTTTADADALEVTRQILERRVRAWAISSAAVRVRDQQIEILLSGVESADLDAFVSGLFGTGLLEFVDFSGLGGALPVEGDCILTTAQVEQFGDTSTCPSLNETGERLAPQANPVTGQPYVTVMTGSGLDDAAAIPGSSSVNASDNWMVSFTLTEEGSDIFGDFTESHIGQPLAIVLDGIVISAPTINARISGEGVITGRFSKFEAESLAIQLRYGALPVQLELAEVEQLDQD